MTISKQTQPAPGDDYGILYKGGFLVPILVIVVLAVALWWFLRKRK